MVFAKDFGWDCNWSWDLEEQGRRSMNIRYISILKNNVWPPYPPLALDFQPVYLILT